MSVAVPITRDEFKEHIMAQLGSPVIQINVAPLQVDIAIEEALKWFWEWHHSGSHDVFYISTPTLQDIQNRYITLPDEMMGVFEVYSLRNQSIMASYGDLLSGGWDVLMEIAYSSSTSGSPLISYVGSMQYFDLLQQIITGQTPIRYNYIDNKLYIDVSWGGLGQSMAISGYARVNPEDNPKIWQDRWLVRYAVAKLKEFWGQNLSKYTGIQLPGGVTFDGQRILNEGRDEIKEILADHSSYSLPPRDFIG